ncbi:MAG: MotA/TolQ/ExbB proton channel family protein [Candidatus Marinimicrobia bacterium]|nr:MotA/TolQ/ExbB proton channel family protein [Candidatus Neomarinimicrobiota bacterium]
MQVATYYFNQGGGYMYPILIILIIGLFFVAERLYFLFKGLGYGFTFSEEVADTVTSSGFKTAVDKSLEGVGPIANLCHETVTKAEFGVAEAEKSMENTAAIEMAAMEKNMTWISLCIATAPMIGFLGTVVGMIQAFDDIKAANDISPAVVAGGISVALLTTAFGLIAAVILQLFQNLCLYIIDLQIVNMQKGAVVVMDSIKSHFRKNN